MKITFLLFVLLISIGSLNAQVFTMSNGTVTACSGIFYDSGGKSDNYKPGEDKVFTINCSNKSATMTVRFTDFSLAAGDWLAVYDGAVAGDGLIDTYSKENPVSGEIKSSGTSLTFVFHSEAGNSAGGWIAEIINEKVVEKNNSHGVHEAAGFVLIYSLRGVKSEQDGEKILKLLNSQDYILASELHLKTEKLYVTAVSEEYAYPIKDLLLTEKAGLGYSIAIDFERSVDKTNHKEDHK